MADEYAPFGVPPAFDPMTGAQIGGDLGRTEPEAYPNKFARALIQVIAGMPKHTLVDAPSALVDSARRAPLPGAERTPEGDAATQDLAGQSFMTALGLAGQSMPFAPHSSAGIFGGRLAKTADQTALRTAEEMHAGGADRGAIWDKTGWFQGGDGKWRFEIPDDKAQMNPNVYGSGIPPGRWGRIAGEVWHKDLYDAYPDLRNATGMVESRMPGSPAGGSYSAPGLARSGEETIHIQSPTVDEARSVGLHELQHAVQEREGFASGGNPAMFKQGDDAILSRDALSYRRELEGLDPSLTPKQKDEIIRQRYRAMGAEDWIPPAAARDIAHDVEGNPAETLQRVMQLYGTDKRTSPYSPRELYRQVPGEIEARNVQSRRDMTPDERRARPPWETADPAGSPILGEMFGSRVGLLEGGGR